eukprot:gnl/TRDRNA2_/TRDRNA2_168490_c0_seq3.p1 gnl/TRDRNA2_/TRDRNA2_168490_c0~~gnl/TRDRNA2_/TRDRNA2_168490_c0_seq3.p1  ORF type:complete len:181 (+),score=8.61 gnl/TRDRNA2_/TRDRNA2_168490_c0_seq3:123-665(+)
MSASMLLKGVSSAGGTWQGHLELLINISSFSVCTVGQKYLVSRYQPLSITAIAFILAALSSLPVAATFFPDRLLWNFPTEEAYVMLYTVFCVTCFNFTMMNWCLVRIDATVVSVYQLTQPVFTALFAWLHLHEPVGWTDALALSSVLIGLVMTNKGSEPVRIPCSESVGGPESRTLVNVT